MKDVCWGNVFLHDETDDKAENKQQGQTEETAKNDGPCSESVGDQSAVTAIQKDLGACSIGTDGVANDTVLDLENNDVNIKDS